MPTVLIVDDEAALRGLVRHVLEQVGYEVLEAGDGLAAYSLVQERRGGLDLLITDIVMPQMTGAELIERLEAEYANLKILCISAYADQMSANCHYFLAKPFTAMALCAMVEKVLAVPAISPSGRVTDG